MSTKQLIKLKVRKGYNTIDLLKKYPNKKHTICNIAMYDIDAYTCFRIDNICKYWNI